MAHSDLDVRAVYTGDGANTAFAMAFAPIVDDSVETIVYTIDTSTTPYTRTLQVEGAMQDYTLTGAILVTDFNTTVTFNTAPANGILVAVIRVLPLTQTLDYASTGTISLPSLELALDRLSAMIQQVDEKLMRAPRLNIETAIPDANMDLPAPVADGFFKWNAAANAIEFNALTIDGTGLPSDGTTGQVLEKIDATDYNTQWVNPSQLTFTALDVDNININGNSIISSDTDGNINLDPNGTGTIELVGPTNVTGAVAITGAASAAELNIDNININANTISSTDANGDINLDPNGTGAIELVAATNVTGAVTISGQVNLADAGIFFTDDQDTKIYRSTDNTISFNVGGFEGMQVKKATGSFGNMGIGGPASVSSSFPLLISRDHAAETTVQISNANGSAGANAKLNLASGAGSVNAFAIWSGPASGVYAYNNFAVFRSSGSHIGINFIAVAGTIGTFIGGTSTEADQIVEVGTGYQLLKNNSELRFGDSANTNYIGLSAPSTVTSSVNFELPGADGSSGQVLQTNGSSVLSFANAPASALNVVSKTTTYTAAYNDFIKADTSGGAFTITLPAAASNSGKKIFIELAVGGAVLTVDGNASETINGSANQTLIEAGEHLELVSDGTNFRVAGVDTQSNLVMYGAHITNSGTPSVSSQTGGTWITSLTDNSTGRTTLNFVSGIFSTAPVVTAQIIDADAYTRITASSTSSVQVTTATVSGTAFTDLDFYVTAIGIR